MLRNYKLQFQHIKIYPALLSVKSLHQRKEIQPQSQDNLQMVPKLFKNRT